MTSFGEVALVYTDGINPDISNAERVSNALQCLGKIRRYRYLTIYGQDPIVVHRLPPDIR